MDPISVLIADGHEITRYGISTYLSSAKDITIVGEASSGKECIKLFKEKKPDICLLDIEMPDKNGIQTVREFHEIDPDAKILILSLHVNQHIIGNLLQAGISGYLLKNTDKINLLNGIRSIMKGQHVFSDPISDLIKQSFINYQNRKITDRELQIIQLIADGFTSKEIATKLYISPRTVDTHRANLMQKLELHNVAELVRFAIEENLL